VKGAASVIAVETAGLPLMRRHGVRSRDSALAEEQRRERRGRVRSALGICDGLVGRRDPRRLARKSVRSAIPFCEGALSARSSRRVAEASGFVAAWAKLQQSW
jgi:hypothetical protein